MAIWVVEIIPSGIWSRKSLKCIGQNLIPVVYHRRAVGTIQRHGPRVPLCMLWVWQLKRCAFTCQRRSPRFSKVGGLPLFSQLFPISWPLLGPYFLTLFISLSLNTGVVTWLYQQHQIPISAPRREQAISVLKYQMHFKILRLYLGIFD